MTTIYVTKRDGSKQPFDADKINKSIERACAGLPDWLSKVTQIATETSLTLYNGITEDELDQATISAALQNIQNDPDYGTVATRLFLKTVYKNILGEFERDNPNAVQELHEAKFAKHIQDAVTKGILREEMKNNFDLEKLAKALKVERDNLFDYAGASTLMHRYTLKRDGETSYETPQFAFMRIAMGLTFIEKDATEKAIELYNAMSQLDYIAGGSANIGSGTKNAALSNCFLIQMEDDMANISKTVADVMMISKATGGLGFLLQNFEPQVHRFLMEELQVVQQLLQKSWTLLFVQSFEVERKKERFVSIWNHGTWIFQNLLIGNTTQETNTRE